MNDFMAIAQIALLICSWFLSKSAYEGGFHYGAYKFLKNAKTLNEAIVRSGSSEVLNEWNKWLESVSVEKKKMSYFEWILSPLTRKDER